MFDTYIRGSGPKYTYVTEKRAPTDESVRLLKEMQKEAVATVVEALRIESCGVETVVHCHYGPMDDRWYFLIYYVVNGNKREVRVDLDAQSKIMDRLDTIWDAVAKDLAWYLVKGIANSVAKN